MSLLEVRGLVVGYGPHPVLHEVEFDVEEGEVCVLLGLNGAGKSTTVNTIAGLLRLQEFGRFPRRIKGSVQAYKGRA